MDQWGTLYVLIAESHSLSEALNTLHVKSFMIFSFSVWLQPVNRANNILSWIDFVMYLAILPLWKNRTVLQYRWWNSRGADSVFARKTWFEAYRILTKFFIIYRKMFNCPFEYHISKNAFKGPLKNYFWKILSTFVSNIRSFYCILTSIPREPCKRPERVVLF